MLTYVRLGVVHYTQQSTRTGRVHGRGPVWEFEACLDGCLAACLGGVGRDDVPRERTLWAFPGVCAHGWSSDAPCERVVFHFTDVPVKLEQLVPRRGYYRVPLSDTDVDRLRLLAREAQASHRKPTELQELQDGTLAGELSLMALRDAQPRALPETELAIQKTRMALSLYGMRMSECPSEAAIARAVHVSPSYLRRLFHHACGLSPQAAFIRLRLEEAGSMLADDALTLDVISERVGYSSASSLSRAIKTYFGCGPRELRRLRQSNKGGSGFGDRAEDRIQHSP